MIRTEIVNMGMRRYEISYCSRRDRAELIRRCDGSYVVEVRNLCLYDGPVSLRTLTTHMYLWGAGGWVTSEDLDIDPDQLLALMVKHYDEGGLVLDGRWYAIGASWE